MLRLGACTIWSTGRKHSWPHFIHLLCPDLPNRLHTCSLPYADDVKIFHRIRRPSDVASLQADLNHLHDWSKIWHLKLNPAKYRVITFTLRSSPITSSYFLDGHQLERCTSVRDFGVMLDSKLTFGDHVDSIMSRANRMLGLLLRSIQISPCARLPTLDHRAILYAYYAHIRSILEYSSVIWAGASVKHLARLERLQHRYLMWLCVKTRSQCTLDYSSLLQFFQCPSIKARLIQADVRFVLSVFAGRLDCSQLVSQFSLLAPSRRSRHTRLLHVPRGRVNTGRNGFTIRVTRLVNDFLAQKPEEDLFHPSCLFKKRVLDYANSAGVYS